MEESVSVGTGGGGTEESTEGEEGGVAAPPPSAPPHQLRCPHCGDPFHQYYNQEVEEWQLRRAVAYKGDNYHPLCLQEFKVRLLQISICLQLFSSLISLTLSSHSTKVVYYSMLILVLLSAGRRRKTQRRGS